MTTTNIQPGELMIGNYLYDANEDIIQVGINDFQRFRYPSMDGNPSKFKPIPLTEQWLLEFGFEKRDESYIMLKFMIEKGISQYFNHGFSFRITIDRDNSCHVANVKYVHTLQNIFYLLTATPLSRGKGKGGGMSRITLINFEWNCYNGFTFSILGIECYKPIDMESALFGINVAKSFLVISLLFMEITVLDKTEKKSTESNELPPF